jgi:methionyl-tRNA synthetase
MRKFFLTTPIYYVNARPHIGHAYTTIVADVLARRSRAQGIDTYFLTGTDEHGQKIERSAAAAGIPPQQFADQVSKSFSDLWARMGIIPDKFIRTTDPAHKRGVQKLFRTLQEKGHIYLDSYTGAYCVSDEAFVDVPAGAPCPDCGRPTEIVTEENYFFRLSAFQQPIIDLIESGNLTIEPDSRRNEVLSFLRTGLKDLSISRSSFTWGIPVPTDHSPLTTDHTHVIYVWLDALANYMTALGYGSDDESLWEKYWPADLHIVGKEIIRFHCVYWPAFLLAAGLPTPKKVVAHGWLLFEESKMSKSKGNIVRTETILDAFGTLCPPPPDPTPHDRDLFASDVLRYFLLREIPFGQDGSFSFDALITRYNADLANGYGNLVSRTLNMISKYFADALPDPNRDDAPLIRVRAEYYLSMFAGTREEEFHEFEEVADSSFLESFKFNETLQNLARLISLTDEFLSHQAPWKQRAEETEDELHRRRAAILFGVAEDIRIITALLYPILPYATASVWRQLGLGDIEEAAKNGDLKNLQWGGLKPGTKLGPLSPIFPRADKGLAQIMTDMESAKISTPAPEKSVSPSSESVVAPASTDPAAGPRTTTFAEPNPGSQVAGSTAHTTGPDPSLLTTVHGELTTPTIAIDDFAKIDLRVAKILVAERIPKADKLLRLEVDLGYETRQILSGIAEWYTPEDLIGRRIVVIANLAPRKMRGLESHGMLLAASSEGGKPSLATFPDTDDLPLGSRLK